MRRIAKEFPGAVLAFCTLRKQLDQDEVREIGKIAKAGRKYWKSERPLNPVLVLTSNEMLSMWGPPQCWKDMGLSEQFDRVYGLLELCNATQQIHLKLPSWHQTWNEAWERKRKRRVQKTKPIAPATPETVASPVPPATISPET